ncbi:MAG: FKBP-type peptidyl-prolyl cis-trans isomerase [Prevotella sp.]|nr:FKBP-type peptidyl-prolyl cis-trans isomerase [Prevotella sp.]
MDKKSYDLGLNVGQQLYGMGIHDLNVDDFAKAVKDVFERSKNQKADGEKYLAENAQKEGVVILPSGLQYKVLKEGNGHKPKATDQVRCHYEGMLIDGTLFDSSLQRGEPATFPLNGVIKGWTEGLQLMQEGAKYRFFIPYHLGYGSRGAGGSIPPFATLIFDVELLEVLAPQKG